MVLTGAFRKATTGRSRKTGTALLVAVLALAGSLVGSSVARAQAAEVDLVTGIVNSSVSNGPVAAGVPAPFYASIANRNGSGGATATNAALALDLPAGAELVSSTPSDCAQSGRTVRCAVDDLRPRNGSAGINITLRFADTGTFLLATSATADQADVDDDSRGELEVVVVEEEADLAVGNSTERALTGTVRQIRYYIDNQGPTASGPVSVTGTFPAGVDIVPGSVGFGYEGDRCTVTTTGYTCESGSGASADGFFVFDYDATMPDQPATIEASLTVSGRNDPDATNNTGTITVEVSEPVVELGSPTLWADDVVSAGYPFAATVDFGNDGDLEATDVVVAVEVPAGWNVALPAAPDPGRTCDVEPAGTVLRCTYESVPGLSTPSFRVPVTPPADGPGTGVLEARIEAAGPGPAPLPAAVSREVRYLASGVDIVADTATHRPEVPFSGPESVVSWTFRNASPDRMARDLTAYVDIPPGVEVRSLLASASGEDHQLVCSQYDLPRVSCLLNGDSKAEEIRVTLKVVYESAGSYPFTATLGQASQEQSPGDESLAHTVEVETGAADLQLTASPSADEVTAGDTYSYVVAVRNDGPHPVSATVTDELPDNVELLSAQRGWANYGCLVRDNVFTCEVRLTPGSSNFIVVQARATAAGTVASAPTVSSMLDDPDPASNTAPVILEVVEPGDESPTDLALTATPPAGPVVAGEPFTTVVEIENDGGRAATDVALQFDGDPTNLEVVSATQGWFSLDCGTDGEVVCAIPTISAGGSTFVEVTTRAPAAGPFAASLALSADADPTNNTITLTGEAVASP